MRLLLLRHRIGVAWVVLRGALQHGHRARVVARATIRCRRIVAIELATCRSGRTGGASGWTILGNLRRRELIGGVAGSWGGNPPRPGDQEARSRDAQRGVMMEAAPAASLIVSKAEFLFQLLIIAFDPPAQLGQIDQAIK